MAVPDPSHPSLFKFADAGAIPDPIYAEDYAERHSGRDTAIVIDNGCSQCRMGWAGDEHPQLVFRNAIARTRGKRYLEGEVATSPIKYCKLRGESDYTCIGNDITNVEAVRSSLKSQFDRNIVSNFVYQEQILDYGFCHLGLGNETAIRHPVVMTEPVCNPSYCRGFMSELLFEAYSVPAVAYGVDALFSAYHSYAKKGNPLCDALIVSSGHQATHILPVLDGKFDARHCKRINVGGLHTIGYLQRLLQLKHPELQNHITPSRAKELMTTHLYVALDYTTELHEWASGKREGDVRVVQLPYSQVSGSSTLADSLTREARDRQRRQRAREQLLRLNRKKREEKIADYELQLERLLGLQAQEEMLDPEEYQLVLEEAGFEDAESLLQVVRTVQTSLEAEQQKLVALQRGPTHELPAVETISEDWLQSLKERKKELLGQKRQRQHRRQELGKRRSAASHDRMRIISQLAEDSSGKKSKQKEDTFGMNDEDWNVYRTISKNEGGSDSEKEDSEISEINKVLEKHDPGFMKASSLPETRHTDVASYYRLFLGVERFRVPEIVFQPTMVGIDQCGVGETMEYILQTYPKELQQRLADNVFVTGGNTQFPGFVERLEVDLRAVRPYQSTFSVTAAEERLLGGWQGAGTWASAEENSPHFVTRAKYSEQGADYFKEHTASNLRITPLSS